MRRSTGLVNCLEQRGEEVLGLFSDIARFVWCPVPPSGCDMSSRLAYKLWLVGGRPWYGGGSGIVFIFASSPSWRGWTLLGTDCGFWCKGNSGVICLRRFWRLSRFGFVPPLINPAMYCHIDLLLRSEAVVKSGSNLTWNCGLTNLWQNWGWVPHSCDVQVKGLNKCPALLSASICGGCIVELGVMESRQKCDTQRVYNALDCPILMWM